MAHTGRLARFRSSFLFRLVAIFTLVAALVTGLVSVVYVMTEIRESRRNNEAMARQTAAALAEGVRLPLFAGNREALLLLARRATGNPEIRAVSVLDSAGRVMAGYRKAGARPSGNVLTEVAEVRSNPGGDTPEGLLVGEGANADVRIGSVRIEYDSGRLAQEIHRTVVFTGGIAFLFWALVSALSYPVLRRATHSFDELLRGLDALREGRYDRVLPVASGDEMGLAAATVNELAATLRRRDEESRRLHRSLEDEIRERTQAEGAARESERTLRQLMDAMPAGVAWWDLEGNVLYMNRYVIELFGYGYDDIRTNDDWYSRVYPDPADRRRNREAREATIARARAGAGGEPPSRESRLTCKDGTVRDVIISNQVTTDRIVAILLDVTERESMRERALRAQKLESLGILAGGIAHNFNNVLTAVLGYIGFARKSLDRPQKAAELLGKAEDASRAAAGIAGQLLTFARGGEPIKKPVSVGRLVEESVSLSLMGSNVTAAIEISPSLHGIEADAGQLGQAINNLLINAVQAMPKGGTVSIHAANLDKGQAGALGLCDGNYIRISVSDRGCGIPETNLKKIFDPYFTTKHGVGTGLGLASVRSIVEKHGGVVAVESEVGQGTTVSLHLPSTGAVDPGTRPPAEAEVPGGASGSVLFMDDEQSIRALVRETLGHRGYRVTACACGEEAVELYRQSMLRCEPFSVAILDLTVPNGLGGKETADRILALDPEAKLIVSSGYSNDPVMAGFRQFGFRAAVPKPYRDEALARELDALLSPATGKG